uniref:NADH-ubiquinone oxidoreductase chain 2 n=1 Tax=Colasposoma dauricum TaxID=1301243 RepID=A0A7U1G3I0_9CUCU|nr:NADH dehydrogenase subunit 2 [Colasposoma dauricum]QQY84935.1 NADH dehydrogenase subunit 2 [Colasposoma dauricum]
MKFYKLMFTLTMIMGTLITISSYSWMSMWMGLEINLLSIIPLLKSINNQFPAESAFKYFIIQSIASTSFLFSMILNYNLIEQLNNFFNLTINIIFYASILTKIGAAPFHAWFPEVLEGLSWSKCFIMLTWQKIAPMIIILQNFKFNFMMLIIIMLSSFTGSILGLNQISLRKIMAYSSINHISWMLASIPSTKIIWLMYFLIYTMISLVIILTLNYMKLYFFHQLGFLKNNKILNMLLSLNFLSLGGLPPFLGFFPKWLTINFLILNNNFFIALMLIIFTLISLFIYTRITFSSLTLLNKDYQMKEITKTTLWLIQLNFLILSSLLLCPIMFNYF